MRKSAQTLTVHYPSGAVYSVWGVPIFTRGQRYTIPLIDVKQSFVMGENTISAGTMLAYDPRAIVKDELGNIIYHPREDGVVHTPEIKIWLDTNQQWAR